MKFLKKKQPAVVSLILLFVIILCSIPTATVMSILLEESTQDKSISLDTLRGANGEVPRLMKRKTSQLSNFDNDSSSVTINGSSSSPKLAIGQQAGTGEGTYNVYDSFNWTGQEVMNTSNEYVSNNPTSNVDSLTITNSTGFNRRYGVFNITNVEAEYNKSSIEDDTAFATQVYSSRSTEGRFYESAMSFSISVEYAYLRSIKTYTGNAAGSNGLIYITESGSDSKPNESRILSSQNQLEATGIGWHEYTFTSPVLLNNSATYFVVMNETNGNDLDYWWWWYYIFDSDDGENEGTTFYRQNGHWGAVWTESFGVDLPLQIEIVPAEWNGTHYNPKIYTNPSDLDFTYESSEGSSKLSTFKQFQWDDSTWHKFSTNTSVSFDLSFVANYTYASTPISGTATYLVNNATSSVWNLTLSTVALNTTYNVRNRTFILQGPNNDWSEGAIYHDGLLVYNATNSGGFNGSIAYNDGDSNLIVNASTLSEAKDWDFSFNAPNYITSFNWQFLSNNVTKATTMDTLEANYTFDESYIGTTNFSIWIEAPDGTLVNSSIDNTFGTNDLYNWDINQSIHNALLTDKANGTYQTYVFWENTTNNQVGFYTRNITVFIHTTLLVVAPDEVLENTWLNMTIHYNATHLATGVNNGNVTGLFGWNDSLETFNQPVAFGLYNLSIWIDGADHSPGDRTNITIYAEMPWYQNHSEIWYITVVSTTILSVIDVPANLILEYGQTYSLQVNYSYSGSFLPEANMTVDGDSENYTEETDHYSYLLDTRNYNSSVSYFDLEIRLNRSGYLTQKLTFNLTVTAGPTSVHQGYTPAIPSIYYTESYSFAVLYNNTVDNEGIINADYSTNHSSAIDFWYFNSSGYYFFNLSSSSLSLGSYQINITLNHSIYQENSILLTFNIVEMPTQPLDSYSISSNQTMVEETITVTIDEYLTYKSDTIGTINNASILLNDSSVDLSLVSFSSNAPFSIVLDTLGIQYGKYNMTIILSIYGHESQAISFNVSMDGYKTEISVEIQPGTNIKQGEDIIFIATLAYVTEGGAGAAVTQQVPLGRVIITFYIVLEYENGTTQIYEEIKETDNTSYRATYTIDGVYTRDAIKLTNITIYSSPGLSGLPYIYSMSANELETYEILPPAIDIFALITNVLIIVAVVLVCASIAVSTIRVFRRRRRVRKQLILRHDTAIEQSFEDIKSIRLILARHQSGLQFYAEKTIAELQADTDALSGMSAAMSSFLEELSESMSSQSDTEQVHAKDKIEVMSREGLHMLIWHGNHSSLIIISEARLPDYFQNRLKTLGHELEGKFGNELKDFYSSDQIPSTVVKKMVRKYIPLHYFCAFVLNEGVLTLDSIKLDKKESKMLKSIKNIMFKIEGMNYFFSEQIISHLSEDYKRSEAINFLDRAIKINLLIEAEQDDLLRISRK